MSNTPDESFQHFWQRTHTDMHFEQVTLKEAPYTMGCGVWNPYKVTLSRSAQKAEVIVLLDNMIRQPTPHSVLFRLSETVEHLEKAETFEEWLTAIKAAEVNNDAHFVHEISENDDPEMRLVYAVHEEYLHQRYYYLKTLTETLQSFFGSDFQFFSEYWIRHILSDWTDWSQV